MDGWAASVLWPWAENKVRAEFPELETGSQEQIDSGSSPFYQKVAEVFNEAVARSQSTSDEMHQGALRKSKNPVTRAFTMFKSDSSQTYNALRQRAGEVLPGKVAHYAAIMGVVPASVKITAARTRFGSCSGKNSLCFSLYLMRYPEAAIDYVVVHELAHIRHHDHSPAFYAEVARVMPDYKERARLLKE